MNTGAQFSPCKTYRYTLWRIWEPEQPHVLFVCLNPSTADESIDDPTIRRCIGFAKGWMMGGMVMVNLFALRSTDPAKLKTSSDPVGLENDSWIAIERDKAGLIVAAWGAHGSLHGRDAKVLKLLTDDGGDVQCLGLTKDGHPKHPLYLRNDAALIRLEAGGHRHFVFEETMSTSYYRLKPPITSVRATVGGGHTQIGIWVNHAKAGEITLRNEEVANVMRILTDDEEAVMRFEDGGRYEYEFWDEDVELDTPLVSESGEIVTLADLGLTPEQLKEYRL